MKFFRAMPWMIAALALTACDDNGAVSEAIEQAFGAAEYRVLHAVPDAPRVDVLVNGEVGLERVDYKVGTGFINTSPGTVTVQVDALVPGGTATVIEPAEVSLPNKTQTSIIAVGTVATIEPLVLTRERSPVSPGAARAEVLHGAPNAPPVDVYVTALDADLSASAKLGDTTLSFKDTVGPVEVPAGNYQVRITLQDKPADVVFDTGEIELPEGADLLIVAVEATGASTTPVSLLLWGADGVSERLDTNTLSNLRVVHASPDTPDVDVVVNGDFANPLVSDLAYATAQPGKAAYLSVAADTYAVTVTDSATQTAMPIMDAPVTLPAGAETTAVAIDVFANVGLLPLADDNRRLATAAKVRLVHGSPTAGTVDIYVTAEGAGIDNVGPDFPGVVLGQDTGYVELATGTYDVTITGTESKTPAIGPLTVNVEVGGIYTVIARDAQGGGEPFGIIALDDDL